jgi:AcrR family transcriptional regulator
MSKKEKIMEAATELFASQGFNGTASSEIARMAGVAQGTVFHHFGSKESLLVSIVDDLVNRYAGGVADSARGTGSGWESLERVLNFSLRFLNEHADAISVAFRESHGIKTDAEEMRAHFNGLMMKIIKVMESCIERGIEDGSIRDVPARENAFLLHIMLKGLHHSQMHGVLETPELSKQFMDFCCRSLCNET